MVRVQAVPAGLVGVVCLAGFVGFTGFTGFTGFVGEAGEVGAGGVPGRAGKPSERPRQAWAAFARGRTPMADRVPTRPLYEPTERRTMPLDVPATVVGDPDREERLGWDRAR
jgi:hypothetical protein